VEQNPVVIFGDVHGKADLLRKLIDKVRDKFGQDVDIYSVGDLIDRGPDSKGVIQICIDEGIKGQMGNHEQWLKELCVNQVFDDYCQQSIMGGEHTIDSYGVEIYSDGQNYFPQGRSSKEIGQELFDAIPDSHKEWIAALPNYRVIGVDGKSYWLIHAGLVKPTAASWRTKGLNPADVLSDGDMMEKISKNKPDSILWPSPNLGFFGKPDNLFHFSGDAVQVFGHRPVRAPIIKEHFIALDTGCGTCHPYTLSAIVLPSQEIIQVSEEDDWV
jgi:hypothetical protein